MKTNRNAARLLRNYINDLEYQFEAGGVEYVNRCSSGTPEFLTEAEYKIYMAELYAAQLALTLEVAA